VREDSFRDLGCDEFAHFFEASALEIGEAAEFAKQFLNGARADARDVA
jgi:hypothetical protein